MRFFITLVVLLAIPFLGAGQTAVSQNFTIAHGLPSNRVYHSIIDSYGFLWLCTDKGVSRYDGYGFQNFTTRDGLTDNEVFHMFEDSKKRIWFMAYNGKLGYYKEGKFYNPENTPFLKPAISAAMYSRAYEDKWGTIAFITTQGGINVLRNETFTNYLKEHVFFSPYVVKGEIYIPSWFETKFNLHKVDNTGTVRHIQRDYAKVLLFLNWISWAIGDTAYNISLNSSNPNEWTIHKRPADTFKITSYKIQTDEPLTPIFIENIKDKCFVGTNKGLYELKKGENKLIALGYKDEHITSATYDFEGNLWLTSLERGIFFQPDINIKKYSDITGNVNKIAVSPYNGDVWAGSPSAFFRINKNGAEKYALPKLKSYNERITSFYFLDDERFLIGSDMCLVIMKNNTATFINNTIAGVKNIANNPYRGSILLARASSVSELKETTKNNWELSSLIGMRSTALLPVTKNSLLVGSNNGLYRYSYQEKINQLILDTRINHLKKDKDGNIWCSSDVSGLYLYKNNTFIHFTEKDGLHSTSINKLFIDNEQNVWLASPVGLIKTKYADGKLNAVNYILSNILGNEQVNDVEKKFDTVLVATTAGLYFFMENEFKKETVLPRLVIKSITIGGIEQAIAEKYQLQLSQNNIQIDFTGISYSTQNLNYRYKVSPGSDEWQYTKSRNVNLVDLNPGTYTFTLQAIKDGTSYSETRQITFKIVPPFYLAWWFYALAIGFLALLITLVIQSRIAGIRKQAFISSVIAESKQKALRAQMNPHFLFNSLISIQSFFLNKRNTEGQEYTSKFSKLIRDILDNSDKELISIEDEIATLTNYTDLENIRLNTPFIFTVHIGPNIDAANTNIPTMLLQPIVENAIWHGINYLHDVQGKINVSFMATNENLIITIEDNGVGFAQSAVLNKKRNHISKGTMLIKERLEAINLVRKNKINYTAADKPEGGAIVTLLIPIENESNTNRR